VVGIGRDAGLGLADIPGLVNMRRDKLMDYLLGLALGVGLVVAVRPAWSITATGDFVAGQSIANVSRITSTDLVVNSAGKVAATGAIQLVGPSGIAVSGTATALMTQKQILNVAMRGLLNPYAQGGLMVGSLLFDYYRLKRNPTNDGLLHDPGEPETLKTGWYCMQSQYTGGTPASACAAYVAASLPPQTGNISCQVGFASQSTSYSVGAVGTSTPTYVTFTLQLQASISPNPGASGCGSGGSFPQGTLHAYATQFLACDEGAPARDGLCPVPLARRAYTPVSAEVAAADAWVVEQKGLIAPLDYAQVLRDAFGPSPSLPVPDTPFTVTVDIPSLVPSSISGQTTTSTAPDGTVTSTAINFAPGAVAGAPVTNRGSIPVVSWVSERTVTTTAPGQAPVSTVTTTSPSASSATTGSENDPCVADPGRLGCIGLGQVPEDVPTPAVERPITATPMTGWGADSGSCPAPQVMQLALIGAVTFDNTVLCSWLAGLRFVILGVAGLGAAGILIGGLKS
jgi:hypothetical protein